MVSANMELPPPLGPRFLAVPRMYGIKWQTVIPQKIARQCHRVIYHDSVTTTFDSNNNA